MERKRVTRSADEKVLTAIAAYHAGGNAHIVHRLQRNLREYLRLPNGLEEIRDSFIQGGTCKRSAACAAGERLAWETSPSRFTCLHKRWGLGRGRNQLHSGSVFVRSARCRWPWACRPTAH